MGNVEAGKPSCASFRPLLTCANRIAILAGAHDVPSAKVAERVGCDGIWASSLEISTSCGQVDDDRITMTEVLRATGSIASAVSIPVLADVGTGWGDNGDIERVVTAFELHGAAGICFEDAAYPKRNSLLKGRHDLVRPSDFAERISRACAARRNDEFLIVARIESLVAGLGHDETLKRAAIYAQAGADAIVLHSKSKSEEEVVRAARAWTGSVPLVLIPTTYPQVTISRIQQLGNVRMLIYANQGLRAAMWATEKAFRQIIADGHADGVEVWVAPVADVLEMQKKFSQKERSLNAMPNL